MQAKVGPLSFFNNVFHVCMEGGAQEARLLIVKVRRSYKVEVNSVGALLLPCLGGIAGAG